MWIHKTDPDKRDSVVNPVLTCVRVLETAVLRTFAKWPAGRRFLFVLIPEIADCIGMHLFYLEEAQATSLHSNMLVYAPSPTWKVAFMRML